MSDLLTFINEIKDLPLDMKNKLIELRAKELEIEHTKSKLALEKYKENTEKNSNSNPEPNPEPNLNSEVASVFEPIVNSQLSEIKEEKCGVCYEPNNNPIFLNCLHKFCENCVKSFIERNITKCPMCRYPIEENKITMNFQEHDRDTIDIFHCTIEWYDVMIHSNNTITYNIQVTEKEQKDINKITEKCNNYLTNKGYPKLKDICYYKRGQGTKEFIYVKNNTGSHKRGIFKADVTLTMYQIKCRYDVSYLNIILDKMSIKGGNS